MRFSDPGFIRRNEVALYAAFLGAPPGDKFLRIYWDHVNKPTEFQIVDTQAGEVRLDNDDLFDIEETVEHTYEGLSGPTERTVRVELIHEDGNTRLCARNRNITVRPPPSSGPAPAVWVFANYSGTPTIFDTNTRYNGTVNCVTTCADSGRTAIGARFVCNLQGGTPTEGCDATNDGQYGNNICGWMVRDNVALTENGNTGDCVNSGSIVDCVTGGCSETVTWHAIECQCK